MTKQLLFWNRGSGRAGELDSLRQIIGVDETTWVEMNRESDLHTTIDMAIDHGCEIVVAAGGDGTVNAIVNALMRIEHGRRPRLAVVPLGTANDFAGTLKIPDDVTESANLVSGGRYVPIDIVRISGEGFERYYANVAAGGNSVRVTEELTDDVKARWGAFSYLRGAVSVLPDMKTFCITADCDGERIENFDSWAVLVANGRTNAGRIEVAPKASPVDGFLDVILIQDGDAMDMVEIVAGNLLGNFLECEQIVFRQVKKLYLRSEPAMRFTLDGEVVDEEPVQFEVVPSAIRMLVGPEFN